MGVQETKIYPINTGWLEADLGTYIFWKGPAGKNTGTQYIATMLTRVSIKY